MKTIFLFAFFTFSINAFSQSEVDFTPTEIYEMLGTTPSDCITKLKAQGYEYSYSDGDNSVYEFNKTMLGLNFAPGSFAVNTIAYSTLDYTFLSNLRVLLLVGFYKTSGDDATQIWETDEGDKKIFITETKSEAGLTQYNFAFKQVTN